MTTVREKLLSFADYKDGWNYGDGITFDGALLDRAWRLAQAFEIVGFAVDAFPRNDGGVEVYVYGRDHYAGICLLPRHEVTVEMRDAVSDDALITIVADRLVL